MAIEPGTYKDTARVIHKLATRVIGGWEVCRNGRLLRRGRLRETGEISHKCGAQRQVLHHHICPHRWSTHHAAPALACKALKKHSLPRILWTPGVKQAVVAARLRIALFWGRDKDG